MRSDQRYSSKRELLVGGNTFANSGTISRSTRDVMERRQITDGEINGGKRREAVTLNMEYLEQEVLPCIIKSQSHCFKMA